MNAHMQRLLDEALALAPDERAALIVTLLDSLGSKCELRVAEAWADEIRHRKEELRSGTAKAVSWVEARARLSTV